MYSPFFFYVHHETKKVPLSEGKQFIFQVVGEKRKAKNSFAACSGKKKETCHLYKRGTVMKSQFRFENVSFRCITKIRTAI